MGYNSLGNITFFGVGMYISAAIQVSMFYDLGLYTASYGAIKPVFSTIYADDLEQSGVSSVDVVDIVAVDRQPDKIYQPGHPKADEDGYIYMAAVDPEEEMVEMLEASRQYENNVEVVSTLRGLMMRTISMGK